MEKSILLFWFLFSLHTLLTMMKEFHTIFTIFNNIYNCQDTIIDPKLSNELFLFSFNL